MKNSLKIFGLCVVLTVSAYQSSERRTPTQRPKLNDPRPGNSTIFGACIDRIELRGEYDQSLLRKVPPMKARFQLRLVPDPETRKLTASSVSLLPANLPVQELQQILPEVFVKPNCMASFFEIDFTIAYSSNDKARGLSQISIYENGSVSMGLY
jgi:hypothetical protein